MSLAARPALSPALENAAQGGNMSSPVPQHAKKNAARVLSPGVSPGGGKWDGRSSPAQTGSASGKKTKSRTDAAGGSKLPKLVGLSELPSNVQAHIAMLETALVNSQEDNSEYRTEYEKIAEEGRLLYTTYASKSNQLKQLAALNVKLQAEAAAAKEKEATATKEAEKEREEQLKWRAKCKEQMERHKDAFVSLEKMKQKESEDAATIKRLQSGRPNAMSVNASAAQAEAMADLERKHKAQVAGLEKKVAELRTRLTAAGTSGSSAVANASSNVASLKERMDALTISNEMLRADNKALLLEMSRTSDGKFTQQAKLELKEAEIAQLSAQLQVAQGAVTRLTRQIEEQAKEHAAAVAELCSQHGETVAQLQQSATDAEAMVATLESQMAPLRQAAIEGEAAREALSHVRAQDYARRLAGAVAERDAWRQRAEQLSVVLENAVATDTQQTVVAERIRETVSYLKSQAARLERASAAAKAAHEAADAKLASIVPMEEQARLYAEHIERVEHRCASLARSQHEAEQVAEAAKQRESEVVASFAELQREVEDQRSLLRDLEECARETETMLGAAMARVATAEVERDSVRAELQAATLALSQSNTRGVELAQERDELKILSGRLFESSQARDAELEEKEMELERVLAQQATLEVHLAAQQQACRALGHALDRKVDEFRRSIDAKQEECATLRKLLDEPREDAGERKKRLELEARLREAEASLECDREAMARTNELLAESEGETKRLRALAALEQNQRELMEVVQEALVESLSEQGRCCCTEARQMCTSMRGMRAAGEERAAHVKEVAKLQKLIEQQNRYINDCKTKANANIRILHSQLTSCKEQLAQLLGK